MTPSRPPTRPVPFLSSHQVPLISTLAEYQTAFWLKIGLFFKKRGIPAYFLAFDDRSHDQLLEAGLNSFNAFELARAPGAKAKSSDFDEWIQRLGVELPTLWVSHERVAFGIRDGMELRRKFCAGASAAETALARVREAGHDPVFIQELGGFLSVVSAYYVAKAQHVDHYFIEPSFFKGRFLLLKNQFEALKITSKDVDIDADLRQLLETTRLRQSIVIPTKDSHHYAPPFRKVFNQRNAKRLLQKWLDQRAGKRQEFGYLGSHVAGHLQMLLNGFRLRGSATALSSLGRFIYYPLHVPGDVALTLRAPEYFDQIAFLDYLARVAPSTHRVVFKEHPAMIGALDAGRLRALLRRYDNLALLPPQTNNYDVLKAADAVVTVNSKSGAEALLVGKPVVVLGDAFYRQAPSVHLVDAVTQLPGVLRAIVSGPAPVPDMAATERFFQSVWDATLSGELYQTDAGAIERFGESLLEGCPLP